MNLLEDEESNVSHSDIYKNVRVHVSVKAMLDELSGALGMPRAQIVGLLVKSLHENYSKLDHTLSGIVTQEFAELRRGTYR